MDTKYKNVRFKEHDYAYLKDMIDELQGLTPHRLYIGKTLVAALELYVKREKRRVRV